VVEVNREMESVAQRFNWTIDEQDDSVTCTDSDGRQAFARWQSNELGWYLTSRGGDGGLDMLSNPQKSKALAIAVTHWNELHFA
jgi:hypothetical protein